MAATVIPTDTIDIIVTENGDEQTIAFHKDMAAFNQYINDLAASKDKIRPSFNHLMRTVVDGDKERLKNLLLVGNTPNGMAVMGIMGELTNEMGGAVEFSVKKRNS